MPCVRSDAVSEVVMPRLSDSMEEGTIVRWLKGDGDEVSRGDELVEIETDKATMTYEADGAGVLEIVAGEGDTLAIGEVIARIGGGDGTGGSDAKGRAQTDEDGEATEDARDKGESGDSDSETAGGQEAATEAGAEEAGGGEQRDGGDGDRETAGGQEAATEAGAGAESHGAQRDGGDAAAAPQRRQGGDGGGARVKASPVARRVAQDLGVDLQALDGTGPGGRIVKADVESAGQAEADEGAGRTAPAQTAPASGTAKGQARREELSRTQQTIARRMAESRATVPDFTLQVDVDMERCAQAREELKMLAGEGAPVPSLNDMVVKACGLALREFPRVNGAYRDGRFELYERVNVGVAVAGRDALVVPTVFDADRKALGTIAAEARALAEKVRDGTVSPPELSGATFTVSNLGMFGIDRFTAVINPPQAAILAVGAVVARAVVRDGEVVPRRTMTMTMGCDHRILYGADAAQFLGRVRDLLEHPAALAL